MITTETEQLFLESRKTGIGSSDIAALMGRDPYKTPLDIYNQKRGLVPPTPLNNHIKRGLALEPIVADIVADELDCLLYLPPVSGVRHPVHRHVLCHPDRVTTGKGEEQTIEIKCPSLWAFRNIQKNGPPEHYVLQLQYAMGILGTQRGQLAIHCADSWETEIIPVEADTALQNEMYQVAETFWMRHVDCGVPPEADAEERVPEGDGELEPLEGELLSTVAQYASVKESIKSLTDELDLLRGQLTAHAGHTGKWSGSGYRLSYTMVPGKKSISKSKLEAAGLNPDDYSTIGKPYPRLDVTYAEELP